MKAPRTQNPTAALQEQALGHLRGGRLREGITLLQQALELNPGSGELHYLLGTALFQAGEPQKAAPHFEKAVRLAPRIPQIQNDCGGFFLEAGRLKEAERHCRKALELKPDYAEAMYNLGLSLQRQDRIDEAGPLFEDAVRLRPHWPDPLYTLGTLYLEKNLYERAESVFKKTAELFPRHAPAWYGLAQVADKTERHEDARRYLEKSLALNPKREQTWVSLIRSYGRTFDQGREEESLDRAERQLPHSAELAVIRATVLRRQGKKEDVRRLLEQTAPKLKNFRAENSTIFYDLAKNYDGIGDAASAFHWLGIASATEKKRDPVRKISRDAFPATIAGYRKSLSARGTWRAAPPLPADVPCPVFLVGFPRSGTTLLDQIFSGHPDIEVAEEKPALSGTARSIDAAGKKPAWELLDWLDDAGIEAARAVYFSALKRMGCALKPGVVFIDKMPLNLVCAPLINRLFPESRFILALRHPCDCVLSSYMQGFVPNEAMVHTIDLIDAARLYDRSFAAWEEAASVMDLKVHTVKYESVVTDLKAEIVGALDFLGLDWRDSVAAFDETAKKRRIRTPSATQVTQKLYTTARGRWHKYREYMGEAVEILRPWAEKFGYEIEE